MKALIRKTPTRWFRNFVDMARAPNSTVFVVDFNFFSASHQDVVDFDHVKIVPWCR